MNGNNKKIIEEIIINFKKTDEGLMYRDDFIALFNNDNSLMTAIVNILLNDLKLIHSLNGNAYILTKKGWDFTTFIEIENKKNDKAEIERLTLKKLKFEQFPTKFWWLILIMSSVISILTTWVNNQISKSAGQQEQQKIEKSLQK